MAPPRCFPSPPEPRLSIVIPTFNGRGVLAECLDSVRKHRPVDSEVIVVDDGSTDGTAEWLGVAHPYVRLVCLETNQGFCKAINAGIRAASAPIIQTLNNDTVVTRDWAENALSLFDDPTVGSVAPLVWLMNEGGLIDSAGDLYHICGWAMNRGHRQRLTRALHGVTEVFGASACAAFFRRAALLRAGVFPEHFRAYYDDVDLAFRVRLAGYRCLYTPYSQVFHHLHHSHNHHDPGLVYQLGLNEERVFWTNLPARLLWRGLLPHLLYITCNVAGRWMHDQQAGAYFRSKWGALREWRAIARRRSQLRAIAALAAFPVRFPVEWQRKYLTQRIRFSMPSVFRFGWIRRYLRGLLRLVRAMATPYPRWTAPQHSMLAGDTPLKSPLAGAAHSNVVHLPELDGEMSRWVFRAHSEASSCGKRNYR